MRFWSFVTKSLVNRVLVYVMLLLLLTISLMGYLAYTLAQRNLTTSVFNRLESVVTLKEDELQRWVTDQRQNITWMAGQVPVRQWATQLLQGETAREAIYPAFRAYLRTAVTQRAGFREIFVLAEPDGQVLISTNPAREGQSYAEAEYFIQGRLRIYVQNIYLLEDGDPTITVATPLFDPAGERIGVLAAHLNLERMQQIILESPGLGARSEAFLVDGDGDFIMAPRALLAAGADLETPTVGVRAVTAQQDGQAVYPNYEGRSVVGVYHWIDEHDLGLLAEVDEEYAILTPARSLAMNVLVAGTAVSVLFLVGAFFLMRQGVRPLRVLTEVAHEVTQGRLDRQVPVVTQDELGIFAQTFNQMTTQLRTSYAELERQVQVRTQALEKRSRQLEAAARVASAVSAIYDVDQLLDETARLIPRHLEVAHVGIFLLDEAEEYAVLRAVSSEGGRRMLARGHRLKLGQGIVGAVARTGQPRIALDVDADGAFVANPDIPATRSEMALPLTARSRVIGVLDVQSEQAAAFTNEDVVVLQTMAEQVALAIQNARLLRESEFAVRELERRYGEQIHTAWQARLSRELAAYHYTGVRVETASGRTLQKFTVTPQERVTVLTEGDQRRLVAPIRMRDHILGSLVLQQSADAPPWSEADLALVEATCDQVGLALDNVRLLDESRERVARERLTGDLAARIRGAATDIDVVLQTTIRELGRLLHATGKIHLSGPSSWASTAVELPATKSERQAQP
ncbi:MAG TPA: GAF domain-containing protein [Anaerolineae bacterium]|nr:GAF domain-containing protein [Anaerolineae bacterium]